MEFWLEFKRALAPSCSKTLHDVRNWAKCSSCYSREKFVLYRSSQRPLIDKARRASVCYGSVHKGRRIFYGYSMMSIFLNFACPVVFWSTMEPMPFWILTEIPRLESFIDFLNFFQPPCLFKPPCLLILQLLYPLLIHSLLLGY